MSFFLFFEIELYERKKETRNEDSVFNGGSHGIKNEKRSALV